ncbi:MAG: right-handed parallel beta-helix repeat-containing protein, partial [Acidobacteriota bacterium]
HLLIDINGYYAPAGTAGAKTVAVDCTMGQTIQAAIDREDGPLVVDVHGICEENVSIVRKNVTLRGVDPLTDGIDGVVAVPQLAALRLRYVEFAQVQNLTIRNGPAAGISAAFSTLILENCRITGHAGQGISATQGTFVDATGTTISQNGGAAVNVQTASRLFCHGCDVTGNLGFAAVAMSGSVISLLNSVVTGQRGLQSFDAYVDIDCVSETSAHACGLNMTGRAAQANVGGVAALFGAGDFTGQVSASDSGTIHILGARQLATGQPGLGPVQNGIDDFGKLIVAEESGMQSQLFGTTNVSGFGRALLRNASTLAGAIDCQSAGDAWIDGTVIKGPGAAVNGCEHGILPP